MGDRLIILSLFVCIGAICPAAANGQALTDNQLYAAYCTGVFADEIDALSRAPNKAMSQSIIGDAKQRGLRFLGYLDATGAGIDATFEAWKRGKIESAQCRSIAQDCVSGDTKREPCFAAHFLNFPPCSKRIGATVQTTYLSN